jgi:UDP-3-O-[3-hydroxymyristoyl] glucosamine N-acyltransferase
MLRFAEEQGIEPVGAPPVETFDAVEPIDVAGPSQVTFCRFDDERGQRWLETTRAGAIFILPHLADQTRARRDALYLPCEIPRFGLLRFVERFWRAPAWYPPSGRNPDVHESARIGRDVRIGPFTAIGPDVEIGDGTVIGAGVHIVHSSIGCDCLIGSNSVIGGPGFGYEDDDETKDVVEFPQIGRVRIGDRVRLGANNTVDRAALGETLVEDDCKFDNAVHIGHNARIGKRCKITAHAMIAGSVVVGAGTWIAPSAAIRDWRTVGEDALIGIGAVVIKDVPDGATVAGNPARPMQRTTHRYR